MPVDIKQLKSLDTELKELCTNRNDIVPIAAMVEVRPTDTEWVKKCEEERIDATLRQKLVAHCTILSKARTSLHAMVESLPTCKTLPQGVKDTIATLAVIRYTRRGECMELCTLAKQLLAMRTDLIEVRQVSVMYANLRNSHTFLIIHKEKLPETAKGLAQTPLDNLASLTEDSLIWDPLLHTVAKPSEYLTDPNVLKYYRAIERHAGQGHKFIFLQDIVTEMRPYKIALEHYQPLVNALLGVAKSTIPTLEWSTAAQDVASKPRCNS